MNDTEAGPLTADEEHELARLEREFEAEGGLRIEEGSLMDDTLVYAGGNERYERICDLRARRGSARQEVVLDVRLTLDIVGDLLSAEELAKIMSGASERLRQIVTEGVRLSDRALGSPLGYAEDGNREAWLCELLSVDLVTEVKP